MSGSKKRTEYLPLQGAELTSSLCLANGAVIQKHPERVAGRAGRQIIEDQGVRFGTNTPPLAKTKRTSRTITGRGGVHSEGEWKKSGVRIEKGEIRLSVTHRFFSYLYLSCPPARVGLLDTAP